MKENELLKIVAWLDEYLDQKNIPDYPNAYNGLQVENSGKVEVIASAVDASLDTIKEAVEKEVDLLIVHHGLYWQGVEMLTDSWREKCKLLLDHDIAVYSSHIPLDIHPEVGNNVLLAKALDLTDIEHCLGWKNINIGVKGKLKKSRDTLAEDLHNLLGISPFTCFRGEELIDDLYIITGGAGTQIRTIYENGGRNFLSGEGTQWTVPYAEEKKMNYILANHYATETFGVNKITELACSQFNKRKELIKSNNQL